MSNIPAGPRPELLDTTEVRLLRPSLDELVALDLKHSPMMVLFYMRLLTTLVGWRKTNVWHILFCSQRSSAMLNDY